MHNRGFIRASIVMSVAATVAASAVVLARQDQTHQETNRQTSQSGGGTATASGSASASASSRGGSSQSGSQRGGASGFASGIDPNKRLYAVWYEKAANAPVDAGKRGEVEHAQYMKYLMQDGTLVMEGPFEDGTGLLLILQTDSDAHAGKIVADDPAVVKGYLKPTVKRWVWRYGGLRDSMVAQPSLPVRRAGGG
ncbi:MAG: hypothetical protein JST30_16465 [Armatimonadetes bacterium]|nr:hypothetical protein [Armatimonadota bacterium]